MIDKLMDVVAKARDYDKLHADSLRLWDAYEKLQQENAMLRKENRQLRRKLHDTELRLLRRAAADAALLGALYFGGDSTSYRSVKPLGMGQRRWSRACALLKIARVHDGKHIYVQGQEEYLTALHVATRRVERDGLVAMENRLPLWLQPKCTR